MVIYVLKWYSKRPTTRGRLLAGKHVNHRRVDEIEKI